MQKEVFFLSTFPSVISANAGSQKFKLNSVHHRRKRPHAPHAHIQSLPVSVNFIKCNSRGQLVQIYSEITCSLHAHTFTCTCCINPLFAPQKNALLPLFEAMEARAHQRAERRKQIEDLRRKKEEEKLVRDQSVLV